MADHAHFSLANQSLRLSTAEDIDPHVEPLAASPSTITSISLNGNTLGVPAAEALASHLSGLTSLHTANLADLFTGRLLSEIPPALGALLGALAKCPRLHTVDLSDNAFGLNTVEPLVGFLRAHVPLRHLVLNNNGLGPIAGARVADALAELAGRKAEARARGEDVPPLETVVCGRNRLENGSMEAWARAFAAHGGVRHVRMVQNGIRPEGIVALLRGGLGKCDEIETLDLQDNTLTLDGGRALADVVGRWTALQELGLGDCYLGARGAGLLGDQLGRGSNKRLKVLRLQYNNIDMKALARIVGAVEGGGMAELRRIELNGNKFSEDDEQLSRLKYILDERRTAAGKEGENAEDWGIDELSDMEEESEEEEEEEEEREEEAEALLRDADVEESSEVAQEEDRDVDKLAEELGKASI
jgi:Ran GTPase-activating protein 1